MPRALTAIYRCSFCLRAGEALGTAQQRATLRRWWLGLLAEGKGQSAFRGAPLPRPGFTRTRPPRKREERGFTYASPF